MSEYKSTPEVFALKTDNRHFKTPNFNTLFTKIIVSKYHNCKQQKQWMQEVYVATSMTPEQLSRYQFYNVEHGLSWSCAMVYSHSINIRRYEVLLKTILMVYATDDIWDLNDENGDKDVVTNELTLREILTGLDLMEGNIQSVDMSLWKSYTRYLYDLFNEMYQAQRNDAQKKRFTNCLRSVFIATIKELEVTQKGVSKMNSFDDYCQLRHMVSAAAYIFQFIEYANDIFVSEEDYQELNEGLILLVSKICFLTNDVYSFEKEYIQQKGNMDRVFNAVAYVVLHEKCSVEEAMEKLIAIVVELEKKCMDKFKELKSDKNCSPDKLSFLEGLELMISSNYQISTKMTRYNKLPYFNFDKQV